MSIWRETYINLAFAFDATLSDVPNDINHLKEALLAIIDLTSIEDGSEPGYGTEAEVRLLSEMDLLYRQAKLHYSYDDWRNKMVRSINDFTISFFGDLDVFINDLIWPDGCVPFYWAELTENGRIDTSKWIICS